MIKKDYIFKSIDDIIRGNVPVENNESLNNFSGDFPKVHNYTSNITMLYHDTLTLNTNKNQAINLHNNIPANDVEITYINSISSNTQELEDRVTELESRLNLLEAELKHDEDIVIVKEFLK